MIVLIGDVIESKQLENTERKRIQILLGDTFEEINKESGSIKAPYTLTLGDEFQAVYEDAGGLWNNCWKILAELHPVSVRFSASVGSIVTPINRKQAIGMDGSAFHAAREGIEKLKNTGRLFTVSFESVDQSSEAVLRLMNSSLQLLSKEMKSWKKIRYQILVMMSCGLPVKKIAQKLSISESAVYKNRDDGDLAIIIQLKESIQALINQELKNREAS
ncbi:SatD family protein [soil metagenome]